MTIRRLRTNKTSHDTNPAISSENRGDSTRSNTKRFAFRKSLIETLETRQLMAVGPRLIGVQPNNSDLIENGVIRTIAPTELTFRFDQIQVIDPASVSGIRVTRAGGDGTFGLPSVSTDFGSDGRVDIQLTSKNAGDLLTISTSSANLGTGVGPQMTLNGSTVSIVLNSASGSLITAENLVNAINNSPVLSARLSAKINGGLASATLGGAEANRYGSIVMQTSNDSVVQPGAVIIGDRPNENEVTLRFAENLPDDVYRLEVFGFDDAGRGITGLRNADGDLFQPTVSGTRQDTIEFRLDLGSKVTGVVPQPVVRNAAGDLVQLQDTIVVYFDDDKLFVENDANGNPTTASVENPEFYQLFYTADTVRNTDDDVFFPVSVRYNASANTATLRFNDDLDRLAGPFADASAFRLRIGTRESRAIEPIVSEAAASAIIDMNTNGGAKVRFTARAIGTAGNGLTVNFVNSNNPAGGAPTVTVNGTTVTVDLVSATTTVNDVISALETSAAAPLIRTTLEPGSNGDIVVGALPVNYRAVLVGLGDTFDTSMSLGTIGSTAVPQTSLILKSELRAGTYQLDLAGGRDDISQRVVPEVFENHINPDFTADSFPGIRTLYYNFQEIYGTVLSQPVSNSISEKQKERVREALHLWSRQLGVQFIETNSAGITFALGDTRAVAQPGFRQAGNQNFQVRIDPAFNQSLVVFSASNSWQNEYGESLTRSAAASIGFVLGLSNAGDLEPDTLLSMDAGFLNFPTTADRNFEPIFPGTQDVIHGQYLHRPEGSDIDFYKFDIDFGPNGENRTGVFVAETFAERSDRGSLLDTRIALYKQVQATATSNLGAGQDALGQPIQVSFTAVNPGKLGNNLQIFVTRSPRGDNEAPLVQVFPNAIVIDINSTDGSETTLDEFIAALDNDTAARALVKVTKVSGDGATVLGGLNITYSPITLNGGRVDLIAQNDDYFSNDSLVRMNLDSGVYYVGISASGNDQYDPTVPDSGTGGKTEGHYELRLTFRAQTDGGDSITDVAANGDTRVPLNGDADALPGGVYDYWFETRQHDRSFRFVSGAAAGLEGQIITLTSADGIVRRFEYSQDLVVGTGNTRIAYSPTSTSIDLAIATATAINTRTELDITATVSGDRVTLKRERLLQLSPSLGQFIDVLGRTIFVDKSAGPNADGSLERPFNNISASGVPNAFAATFPGDIVRFVSNGGVDGRLETLADNLAFEIGFGLLAGSILSDGATMDVPRGVNVMVEPGVIFKSNRARIGVGSSTLGVDRSGGSLQILGAPVLLDINGNAIRTSDGQRAAGSVYFTSWLDETIGLDNYLPSTRPNAGDWGGIVYRRDLDKEAGRFDLEDEGIFLQYMNHADVRFGGSNAVVVDSVQRTVHSVEVYALRPTITNNRITNSAGNAILASQDSFQETLFSEPLYQRKGLFTPDYDRVGLNVYGNTLLNNSLNGLFVHIPTLAGGALKQLEVPVRFDDTDIVHVFSENMLVKGLPGASLLDQTVPPTNFVSLQAASGGELIPGTYTYKVSYVDQNGYETPPSEATQSVVLVLGQTAVRIFGLPAVTGEYVARRLYRSDISGGGSYRLVAELDANSTSFVDRGQQPASNESILLRDRPNISAVGVTTTTGASTLAIGTYNYRIVMVDAMGREGLVSNVTQNVTTTGLVRNVRLTNLPAVPEGYVGRRIYRSAVGGAGTYVLAATVDAINTVYVDNGATVGTPLSIETFGNLRPTLSASVVVDPGMIVKLEGARIELGQTANLIAEGTVENRIVFTSKLDDRFGAGGTFDTNNNGLRFNNDAARGDWSGIYASPGARLNLDYGVFAYAGGVSRIEGTLKAFSPIELQQSDARIAHITFENNANGMGGQGPIDRLGRPANENYPFGNNASRGSTLFIRGTQPIVLGNIFQNNTGTAMTIDINSMDAKIRGDIGRQTGEIGRDLTSDANRGPLFRGNKLFNNGINGLEIRADATTNNRAEGLLSVRDLQRNSLSTESVWDDTDIVHVLFDSVTVTNLQHSGGLRLQSAVNESLVVKMEGPGSNFDQERGTGFTATGYYGGIENRVGGTIHVIGQPNFPVIFTSLRDDTVGAGTRPDGTPQTDTNNDGFATVPRPGDWRSLLFDTYSNDRNVRVAMEIESPNVIAPGVNDNVLTAQFLGALAPNASKSDENLPLGYVVNGVISEPGDQDVYSFTAEAGTEVWFDIDSTSSSLDSVIELLNGNGEVLARSTNSVDEQSDPSQILKTDLIDPFNVNPLIRRTTAAVRRTSSGVLKDDGSTNEKDAGFRILLPGVSGAQSTFFVRVRSKGINVDNPRAGLTDGSYTLQIRLQDMQEYAGSIVQFADVRYATNGVQANGLPSRSPFTGEAKVGMYDGTPFHLDNNSAASTTTNVGNVHMTDLQAISVAGTLASSFAEHRIVFSVGVPTSGLVGSASGAATFPIVLDVDYADGLNRPNLQMILLNANGTQVGTSSSSNIFDDQAGPLRGADLGDLSRGSVGVGDPLIKASLPRGTYTAVIRAESSFSGSGAYQLEIRTGDANTGLLRGAFGTSIDIPNGLVIPDKSVMEMSDGANRVRFQFTYDGTFDFGNTPIPIDGTSTPAQIARAIRDAINAMFTQNRWRISAANSNGIATGDAGTNKLLHLVGNVDFLSGADLLGPGAIIISEGKGDVNVKRDQGQFVVSNSVFTNVRDYAVWSAPADKYYANGVTRQPLFLNEPALDYNYTSPPALGGAYARNLPVLNTVPFGVGSGSAAERAGVSPGMIVVNNLFDSAGLGGLHIQGEAPVWRITSFPGALDRVQNANDHADHSGWFINDGDQLLIDFQRQRVRFEFEDIAGAGTGAPAFGSGVIGGNGLGNSDAIPIYYREDTGGQYMRPAGDLISGDATDDVVKQIHGSLLGSTLVTNGTTQRLDAWVEPQADVIIVDPDDQETWIWPTASIVIRGPQSITQSRGVFDIERLGEFTAAPFVRAVNNTIVGINGRASFSASTIDVEGNSTISGATETWQGTGVNPKVYTVDGTLPADPLTTESSDVDMYKFRMEVGHRVRIDLTTISGNLGTALRIFNASGVAQDIGGAPIPSLIEGNFIDFTATVAGDYYLGISAAGNNGYDPLSFADRTRGTSSGGYRLNLQVIRPINHVITVDNGASYQNGETFTVTQVSDIPGQPSNTRTFEIVVGGQSATPPANGNIPVYIGPEYRTPDVARAIASAINNAGMNNIQNLPNGFDNFGNARLANPLAPVSAIAINGENGFDPTFALSQNNNAQSNPDVGIDSGAPRGAQLQAGLNRYRRVQNDFAPVDVILTQSQSNGVTAATTTQEAGTHRGFGHDRTMSIPVLPLVNAPVTATGQGTTEKYVIVRNAYSIVWNNRRIEGAQTGTNFQTLLPETGILVSGGASPTLMNNVFFNVQTPIVQERSGQRPAAVVVTGNTYQYFDASQPQARLGFVIEASPTNVPNTGIDFNQSAGATENLFVNVPGSNLLPNGQARIIDSAIDSLPEREGFRSVKQAVGISPSPILSPDRDLNGVLRADDPTVAPPNGLGGNIFKDRGALERADFIGPSAIILNPTDNDAQGVDQDKTESIIVLNGGVYPEFRIQLKDGFETANLGGGTGILDDSVVGRSGGNRMPGSAVTVTENGRLLVEGVDYAFSYDSTTDQIVLKPLAGVWRNDRVYDISLNNRDRFVIDASTGDIVSDGDLFTVRDSLGGAVIFEYDSGYRLQIPQGIEIQIPLAGGGAGGIVDGDRFIVFDGTTSHTFEFDSNNNFIAGQNRIPFTSLSTKQNIADAVIAALSSVSAIQPQLLSNGNVFVGAPSGVSVDTTATPSINQPNSTLALQVPTLGTRPGGINDGQTFGISDGRTSFVFEFDSDNAIATGNVRIDISQAATDTDVANAMLVALNSVGLGINPTIVGQRNVHLSLTSAGRVDLISTNLSLVGVSRAIADGQQINIQRTTPSGVVSRTFEFTTDALVTSGNIPVAISSADSQEAIGVKLADAIKLAGLGLDPRHVRDGNVFIGGSDEYTISVAQAPTVGLFGRPGVRGNSTLDIFGTLLMQLPTRGGADIPEDSTFTITANSRTVTFEFDSNFSGASLPNNVVINYNRTITAADLVTVMLPIIANAGLGIAPRDAGGGQIDLGLLPNNAVNTMGSGITLSRGNVLDGDFFTINNGTTSVTFEFENLSIGNGRDTSRLPIQYNNQSTRLQVLQAMKATIESSGLGLTTEIQGNGLKLLDNPRYNINIDNAPSLALTGVPGGAIPINFVQDQSFTVEEMRNAIIRAINQANDAGRTSLTARVRGGSTLFVENATTISPEVTSFFLRGISDNASNLLKTNRINGETQFTILMPGITLDYGDTPDPVTTTPGRYPTSLEYDGARHVVIPGGLRFGDSVSSDLNGRPTPLADGDQGDDGVDFRFQGLDMPLFNRNVGTNVSIELNSPGFVDGWIDFNADGDWNDPGEHVVQNVEFTTTTLDQTFNIRVPSTFPVPTAGLTSFARFRTSTAGNHLPTGLALDGEVEDYMVRIIPGVPPVPATDRYTMDEDQLSGLTTTDPDGTATPGFVVDDGVLANDQRLDSRPLRAKLVSFSGPGELQNFNSNGTFTYVPPQDFFGQVTLVYRPFIVIDEARGEIVESETLGTATITIRPVNDAPTANTFVVATQKNVPITLTQADVITRSAASPGPLNEASQTLTLTVPNNVSAQSGSVSVVGGVLTYLPALGFVGTDTFVITLTDNGITGELPDPRFVNRIVTVTVANRNDPPVTTPKSINIDEDEVFDEGTAFFMNGDSPVEIGQTLAFTGVEANSMNGGRVEFIGNRVFYTPALNFNGTDTFYYFVTDNDPVDPQTSRGTVSVTIASVNDAPVRIGSSLGTNTFVEDGAEQTITLPSFFTDPDIATNGDELTYSIASIDNQNLLDINFVGGTMFVRPRADANGNAIVNVRATDRDGLSVTSQLTVVVTAVNDTPRLATPLPNVNVNEDLPINPITLSPTHFFDPDVATNGDQLRYEVVVSNPDVVTASVVNGALRLNLVADASGFSTITVTAIDNAGNRVSDTFDLVVAPVNDAPRSNPNSYLVPLGSVFATTDARGNQTTVQNDNGVLWNDTDPEGNSFTATLVNGPTRGTVALNPDGTFTYRSDKLRSAKGDTDTFSYRAVDSLGAAGAITTVTLSIVDPLPSSHQNPTNQYDVNADGFVSPIDVLLIINFINERGSSTSIEGLASPPPYRDVDGNEFIDPLDVLTLINFINSRGEGEGEGEGTGDLTSSFIAMPSTEGLRLPLNKTTLRDGANTTVEMDIPVYGPQPLAGTSSTQLFELTDYLSVFEDEDEEIASALLAGQSADNESLDAFFADVFRE